MCLRFLQLTRCGFIWWFLWSVLWRCSSSSSALSASKIESDPSQCLPTSKTEMACLNHPAITETLPGNWTLMDPAIRWRWTHFCHESRPKRSNIRCVTFDLSVCPSSLREREREKTSTNCSLPSLRGTRRGLFRQSVQRRADHVP